MKVEVAVLGSPTLLSPVVYVAVKPEEGLLTIDKDFLSLSVFIWHQRGQNHKDNQNAGSLYMKQFTS